MSTSSSTARRSSPRSATPSRPRLFWGTYFVEESAKPDLYDFGAVTVKAVVIERKDAGNTMSVTFQDPQIRRQITVDKVWYINGVKYTGGLARDGFSATLGLSGGDASTVDWGKTHDGYLMGQTAPSPRASPCRATAPRSTAG